MKKPCKATQQIIGVISVILLFSLSGMYAQCTVNPPLNAHANIIAPSCNSSASATIQVTNNTGPVTYSWSPNVSTTNSASNLTPGTYSVQISDGVCRLGNELVVNGDFSAGTAGFTSGYIYTNVYQTMMNEKYYAIDVNPQLYHIYFWGTDHTTGTGKFMIVNGDTAVGANIWSETISVTPNTNYVFSAWLSAMNTISAAQMQFSINGTQLGGVLTAPNFTNMWSQFCTTWNSGSNTTANISILNKSTVLYGNDFGLDDISFRACAPASVTFTVGPSSPPVVNATSSGIYCNVGNGTATAIVSGGATPYTYQWSNGQTTSTATNLSAGNYSVVVSDINGCSDTAYASIASSSTPPSAAFSSIPVCFRINTQLNDGSTAFPNDPITNWSWNIPGATPSTSSSQNPNVAYASPGVHTATLVITTSHGCKDTVFNQITVYNNPQPNFTGGKSGCAPVCAQFTDASTSIDGGITNWQWNFNGGNITSSNLQNPNVCYNAPGAYGATLTVVNSYGCTGTTAITPLINVHPYPKANFCMSQSTASVDEPVFSFCPQWSNDVTQWHWNFGDNTPKVNNVSNPVHSYASTANGNDFYSYVVSLVVQNQFGCKDSIAKPVTLTPDFVFYIPNTFTPNGDGLNENFYGKGRGIKEYKIMLFDRWGNLIWDCSQ